LRDTVTALERVLTELWRVPVTVCCRRKGVAMAKEARVMRLRNFMMIVMAFQETSLGWDMSL
jgi:hypothetical protein